ncbi:hypothetical protein H072_2884 [Dactylellina haptotyla CBS 200.50]|uniref:Ubiquitin-like-conjugating enzyme ATG10 n=1 Tax=Dactylellina haptotyla (strain CBS 200.50) TaxID=1284197 RepID=S8BUH5_DACHA|nr:hypothetical protein H072_2884 [Dactylellina haptotyla CBS 200.50]
MATQEVPALPFLSRSTFAVAIDHLITHLDSHSSLKYEVKNSPHDESDTYLEIIKHLHASADTVTSGNEPVADGAEAADIAADLEEIEDDPESYIDIPPPASQETQDTQPTHKVTYHILLSPIYSVPVLYFTVSALSPATAIYKLDDVYSILVPPDRRGAIAEIGIQGGISQTQHPYLGNTVWFIHPCRTAEALRIWGDELTVENYLGLWIGVVGSVVGLIL